MREKILFIDTSDNTKTIVGLIINGEKKLNQRSLQKASQNLLPLIEQILQENNFSFRDLTAIEVNAGPGSFTGLRVGVAVANTLGSFLQIPINKKKVGEIVDINY